MGDSNMQADSQGTSSFHESIDDSWVSALAAKVQQSSEWGNAISSARGRLMELVSQKNGMLFSDLNGEQRMALIDELEVDMWDKDDYSQFAEHAASKVEEVLLVQAMKKGTVSGLRSGREYMSQAAAEGAGMLLRRWPEGIEALSELGNSPLPEAMRREAWLAKVRERTKLLDGSERALQVSDSDNEITALVSKAIKETGAPELAALLPQIKGALSHMHSADGGRANSHLVYMCLPMAWLVSGKRKAMGQVDAATVYEAIVAIQDTTGHDRLLEGWGCNPRQEWFQFVAAAGESLGAFDSELHTLLTSIMVSGERGEARMASGQPLHRPKSQVWEFAGSEIGLPGSELGPIFYPIVGRLFVGIMGSFEASCYVWDLLFLHGFHILPQLCAAYLVTLRSTLTTALSSSSNANSLEQTLNLSNGTVPLDAMQRTVEAHVMPVIRNRKAASTSSVAEAGAAAPKDGPGRQFEGTVRRRDAEGKGKNVIELAAYMELAGVKPQREMRPLTIKVVKKRLKTHEAGQQTEASVSNLADPARVLSPSHHSSEGMWNDSRVPDAGSEAAVASGNVSERGSVNSSMNRSSRSMGADQISSVKINYAGSTHILRIPQVDYAVETLSSLADRMTGDITSERLMQDVIKYERQMPSFVARVIGASVRLPRASNLDMELIPALRATFPTLPDDYDRPTIKYEDASHPHPIYISPPEPGKEEEVILERLAALRLTGVPEARKKAMVSRLEEYVRVPGRGPLKDELAERTPVGVTMTIDDEFGTMVGKSSDVRAARLFGDRVRAELAKILDCPLTCIEISGVYRGSIIVDFNIYPPEDSPRTARQLFSALSAMVPDPESPLHTEVQACSRCVRVLLRGSTHDIFEKAKGKKSPVKEEDAADPDTSALDASKLKELQRSPSKSPAKSPVKKSKKKEGGGDGGGGVKMPVAALAKLVGLQQAAKDMQVGFSNKKIFYSVGKERRGPATWEAFARLYKEGVVTDDSYVWYKAMGKEWKRLSENEDMKKALTAQSAVELAEKEGLDAMREVSAIRIQRFVRAWLAEINRDLDYDWEEEQRQYALAPDLEGYEVREAPEESDETPKGGIATYVPEPRKIDFEDQLMSGSTPERAEEGLSRLAKDGGAEGGAGVDIASMQRRQQKQTTSIKPEIPEEDREDAAMMFSLAGIMKSARAIFMGSETEEEAILMEMGEEGKIHDERAQEDVDVSAVKPFLDGAMFALELLLMGTEEESSSIIRQKHEDERKWNDVVSDVEQAVLGGSLEDQPLEREKAWAETGPKNKALRKALEKVAKEAGVREEKEMTVQTWQQALAGQE